MKEIYTGCLKLTVSIAFFFSFCISGITQTTINTTVGSTGYTDNNGVTGDGCVTFVVANNSGGDILLTQVGTQFQTASDGTNVELWYSSTSLSDAVTVSSPDWTQIASGGPIAVPATGIYDLFSGLSFLIPSGAEYRFAVRSSINIRYSGTAAGGADPDEFTDGGVTLKVGEALIAGEYVGFGGAFPTPPNSPRWFTGTITFQPAGPCTSPPTPGTAVASPSLPICLGTSVQLGLSGQSVGTGQTYVWQSASAVAGPYTDISPSSGSPILTVNPAVTTYYRAAVTCGGNTEFSAPVQVFVNPAFPAGTYTINSGLPTGAGNYQTFAEAINAISCGITGPVVFDVALGSGPYNEQVVIPEIGNSSGVNTVTFNGNLATLSFNSSTSGERAGIVLNGADHILIDSLIIDGTSGTYGWGVHFINQADSNTVSNCIINVSDNSTSTTAFIPIVFSNSATSGTSTGNNGNYNLITGNTLQGGYYGITMYGSTSDLAMENVISNNKIMNSYTYGVYALYQSGALITGNDISKPTRTNVSTGYGIYLNTGDINCLVEKNRVHNMFDGEPTATSASAGVYVTADAVAGQENKIINNLIYSLGGNGTQYGIANSTGEYMQAYHNTISLDDQSSTAGITTGLYQTGAAPGLDYRNNIVVITRSGTGTKRCIDFATTGSTISSNNNVLYMNVTGGTSNHLGEYGTTTYTTLADWQTANSNAFDQLSISLDPLFVNPAGGDFTPTEASVNNIGENLGVATDILGVTRGSSPDPGAFEFTLAGCTNPPVAGTASSTLSDVCPNFPFGLDLQGNSVGAGQTYQWQSSPTNAAPWTNVGGPETSPIISTSQTENLYYRCAVTCSGGTTVYSTSVLVTSPPLVMGSFTINGGLPTGSGNFQSFAEAISSLSCGIGGPVVFNVALGSGPYNEQVVIPEITGASAVNTITFKGNLATLMFNSTTSADRAGILLDGADHIIIDSLTIDGSAGTYGWGIRFTNGADSNIVSNCVINVSTSSTTSSAHGPIVFSASGTSNTSTGKNGSYNVITGNTLTGGYYGVTLYGSSSDLGINNEVSNNKVMDMYGYGIYVSYQDGALISRNEMTRPTRTASTTTAGVYFTTGTINSIAEKNRVHNLFDALTSSSACYGIYVTGDGTVGQENKIINNLIYSLGGNGQHNGTQYGIGNGTGEFMQVYHNTILLDDQTSTSGTTTGLYQSGAVDGLDYRNNIVIVTRSGTGTKRCIDFSTTGSTIVSNNNVLYMNVTGGTNNHLCEYGTTTYTTLADWQTANSNAFDQQSLSLDPAFANPASGDFTPTSSLVNNSGVGVGVMTDIVDSTRDALTPDPGAFEFSTLVAGVNMSAELLVTPSVNPNGCYTAAETVTIKIRNNSTGMINFASNPVTVTVEVIGATMQTLTTTLTTGTLAPDGTMDVVMPVALNMTSAGVYTFNGYTTVTGDANPADDAMLPTDIERVALDPGTVVASPGIFCVTPGIPTLSTSGETAVETYQWQQSTTSGTGFTDIVGATGSSYTPASAITQDMYYRLIVSCGASSLTSPEVSVIISNPQLLTTTPATRCGPGDVTLSATSSPGADIKWYADATGGTELASGANFTTTLTNTTDFYVEASQGGSGGAAPVIITEMDLGGSDQLEIQNVSGFPVDITGWKVALSDSYTDITSVNGNIQTLTGVLNPGDIMSWTDASGGPNYWGSNILWNPGNAGWAAILDNNNNLVDIVFFDWLAADIQGASVTIGTTTITVGSQWSGDGVDVSSVPGTESVSRQGSSDNNDATDFAIINLSVNATNPGMTLPFSGFGCTSPRIMVTATVTAAPSFAISQDSTVCSSSVTALTVESTLSDFDSYTWSPITGLFTDASATTPYTGGSASTVYASLGTGGVYKYFATANNSTSSCSNIDSVELTVLPAAISIAATQEEICVSGTTTLTIPSGGYGTATIQWYSSPDGTTYTAIAGATSATYTTPTLTSTTYYKAEVANGTAAPCLEPVIIITVNNPQVTGTTPASRCGPGTITLGATGSAGATLNWYTDAVGGAPVGTGTSFTTPSLNSSATYYVGASNGGGGTVSVGPTTNGQNTGYTLEAGLFFDVVAPSMFLSGVYVYPVGTGSGDVEIALKNSADVNMQTTTITLTGTAAPGIKTFVPLNWTIPTGSDYSLVMLSRSGGVANLVRDPSSSHPGFPYTLPGIVSITSGKCCPSNASTSYYYFYDWQITTGCESARVPVDAVIADNTEVTTEPVDMVVCPGDNVTFSVSAVGGTIIYQWRKDGVDIAGATSSDFTITGASAADAGSYDVIVNGDCGVDTSLAATLTINEPTDITVQPVDQSACAGEDVTFSVTATGGGTLVYQWQKDGTDISGATSADYSISGVTAGDVGNYNVIVTGDCGMVTSTVVTLSLNDETTIVTQPVSQSACEGDNVTLSVVANGTGTLMYQWQKDGTDINGATSADYIISGVAAADAGSYNVVVTGDCGMVTSSVITLTTNAVTVITTQPADQTICEGDNVTLSVTASGTNISYQWRVNGSDISGAISSDLTITGAIPLNSGNYEVVVTGDCGVVTSAIAILTVNGPGSWTGAISSDWNNAANWCGGVPTSTTDVTIPSSAPNMPNLNGGGEARNITLNTGSTLSISAGGVLDLYGSISGGGTFTATNGSVSFLGTTNQSAPGFTATNVTVSGAGGFSLGGNTGVTGTLTLTMGNITLGANNLTLGSGSAGSTGSHIITNSTGMVIASNLAASQSRTIPVGSDDAHYNPVVLEANAGHTTDNFMIRVREGVFENGVSGSVFSTHVANQMWIINEAVAGGSNVNITLQWTGSQELPEFDRSKCYVMQHDGTQWIQGMPSAASGANPYTQTKMNVTSFSPFAVQTQPIPRPVTGIYPNPTSDYLNVVTDLLSTGPVVFSVFDAKGQLVYQKQENLNVGLNLTRLELGHLSSGIYLVKVSTRLDREFLVQRFLKTN